MSTSTHKLKRTRAMKAGGLAVAAIGAGVLLGACGPGTISAQIGNGTAGYSGDGGAASAATLNGPTGVVVDAAGNAYVAGTGNCVIRKYTKSGGNISTLAGNGTCGFSGDNGPAVSAELDHPNGLAIGSDGLLYIADRGNNRIRTVTIGASTPAIATFAGSTQGAVNGARLSAKFNAPVSLAFDSSGNLFVADSGNQVVREIASGTGTVSTFMGSFGTTGTTADGASLTGSLLNDPEGVATDSSDDVYVSSTGGCTTFWIDTSAVDHVLAGNGTCGYSGDKVTGGSPSAELNHPTAIAVDANLNAYIADTGNNVVRAVDLNNTITTFAGNGTAGYAGNGSAASGAELNGPSGLAVNPYSAVWVSDTQNNVVRTIELAPAPTTTVAPTTVAPTTVAPTTTVAIG